MTRTLALAALLALTIGCARYHTRAQGPFARHADKDDGPPARKPLGGQSKLGIEVPAPTGAPNAGDDRGPVPPRDWPGASGVPAPPPEQDDPGSFPPLRKRPEPKPGAMPSPFAPKEQPPSAPYGPQARKAGPGTDGGAAAPAVKPEANALADLKALLATANTAWKALDTFEATLTRREINPQGMPTSEVVLFQFRREPMAVFTRTVSENGKGREVVYNPSKHGDKLYLMLGKDDHPLFKAGKVLPGVSPDDPRVKEKARNSIRDAGFGKQLAKLSEIATNIESGKQTATALTYHGPIERSELPGPLKAVTHNLAPGDDPLFPKGGSRTYFFDLRDGSPSRGLPVLIVAADPAGKEAEYYLFEKLRPVPLTDADFTPDRLGKK